MGIRFLNADFLSWFEDGFDKNLVDVGSDRPKEHYITAMRWIKEAADENNMLFKAVMPHLKNEAEVELRYSHMVRINEDVASGTRSEEHTSELQSRGHVVCRLLLEKKNRGREQL